MNAPESIADLKPDPQNPRAISSEAFTGLGVSLREFGDLSGLTWNARTGLLVCGHQRLAALEAAHGDGLRLEAGAVVTPTGERFPVRVVDWPADKALAANIAANNPHIAGEFTPALAPILAELNTKLPELSAALRLDAIEVPQGLLPPESDAEPQIDRAAELNEKWQVKSGDLWLIGEHCLLCGDSTKAEDVARVMGGERAGATVTDPPYGMNLDTDWSQMGKGIKGIGARFGGKMDKAFATTQSKKYAPVIGDDKPFDPAPVFALWSADEMFLFGADYYAEKIPGRTDGSWLVWDKRKESQSDGFGSEFELIWSRARHKGRVLRHMYFGLLREGEMGQKRVHPTQKPVSLIADIIRQWTPDGCIVADPYAGSGTTLVACENLKRRCRAIEINPPYCAVTIQRMADAFPGIEIARIET